MSAVVPIWGVSYTPQRGGFTFLADLDRGETSDDLAQIAALGLNTLRLQLRWEDLQPSAQRINSAALRNLEIVLEAAARCKLQVIAGLFPVSLGGGLHLPSWASRIDPVELLQRSTRSPQSVRGAGVVGRRRERAKPSLAALSAPRYPAVIYEAGYHRNEARDLYADQAIIAAQRHQIAEVVGYFAQHPAIIAWQLGEGFELGRAPTNSERATEWYARTSDVVREHGGQRTMAVIHAATVLSATLRLDQIVEQVDQLGIAFDHPLPTSLFPPSAPDPTAFVYQLAATIAGKALLVTGIGHATHQEGKAGLVSDVSYGRQVQRRFCAPNEQAERIAATIEQLRTVGGNQLLLAHYADYATEHWQQPPLDRSAAQRTQGFVDITGRLKPLATVVQQLGAPLETGNVVRLPVDVDRYWREPRREVARLWRAEV
jgi:hypothetical protein